MGEKKRGKKEKRSERESDRKKERRKERKIERKRARESVTRIDRLVNLQTTNQTGISAVQIDRENHRPTYVLRNNQTDYLRQGVES